MKALILNLLMFFLVAIISLPFLALFGIVFLMIGCGWAYAGPQGCHCVINPIGYAMLILSGVGVFSLFLKLRKLWTS